MIRLLLNVLLIFILIRLMRPVFDALQRRFFGGPSRGPVGGGKSQKKVDYSDLTSYEIEDGDFEEINRE